MIDLVELYDLMQLINQYLITADDIRFKEYVVSNNDTVLFQCSYDDDYQLFMRQMKHLTPMDPNFAHALSCMYKRELSKMGVDWSPK